MMDSSHAWPQPNWLYQPQHVMHPVGGFSQEQAEAYQQYAASFQQHALLAHGHQGPYAMAAVSSPPRAYAAAVPAGFADAAAALPAEHAIAAPVQPAAAASAADPDAPSIADDPAVSNAPSSHGYAMLIGQRERLNKIARTSGGCVLCSQREICCSRSLSPGENFRHILRSKHVQLGRIMQLAEQAPAGTIGVSNAKNISRIHAALRYDPDFISADAFSHTNPAAPTQQGAWVVTCLGKNGMQHEGQFRQSMDTFAVAHRDRLQIGDTPFYFLLPKATT
jgi:hypothetical protein